MKHRGMLRIMIATALVVSASAVPSAAAQACPNESVRASEPFATRLPDCRGYEQVSPVAKNGNDALGEVGQVRTASSGNGITYFSLSPFPSIEGGSAFPTYLSNEADGAWTTQGLLPPTEPSEQAFVTGLTPELTSAVVNVRANSGEQAYIRDTTTGARALLTSGGRNRVSAFYASSSADGKEIVFDDSGPELIPGIENETFEPYVYEWDRATATAGSLSLISIVNGAPVPAVAGASQEASAEHAVSTDGARVYFTDTENANVFVREPGTETTRAVSLGEAVWRAATPDGRFAFYTEAGGLFRFNADRTAGAERTTVTESASGTLGVLGASADGTRVFFVATEVLASNTNAMGEGAVGGGFNLYEWHEGTPLIFVAGLNERDEPDWFSTRNTGEASETQRTGRVSEDGLTMMFLSQNQLTPYDNKAQREVYLYGAGGHTLACASCNPTSTEAVAAVSLTEGNSVSGPKPPTPFETRNLSNDGDRVFFQTPEALLSTDSNAVIDVYEWERSGHGTCEPGSATYVATSGGCLFLISTGQGNSAAYFGDASPTGTDAYFFTRQQLVKQDTDNNLDVYDAREAGGLATQNLTAQPPCESEGGCRGGASAPSVSLEGPASLSRVGVGNLPPPPAPIEKPVTNSSKPVTRALARARKACKRKRNAAARRACLKHAQQRFGAKKKAKGSGRKGPK